MILNILIKILNKIRMLIQFAYFRCLYGNKLNIEKDVRWRSYFSIIIENDAKVMIGKGCKFNYNCSINSLGSIKIGNYSIFGEGLKIYDHNHRFNINKRHISDQGMSVGKIIIGKNCWLGSNVVVLKGSIIGDNCVIGAGCIVSGNIPANSVLKTKNNYSIEKIRFKDE